MALKLNMPFGKKEAVMKTPSKTTMNLAIRENDASEKKGNIIIIVIVALAVVLLGKFGFLDVYNEWQTANDLKNQALSDQADAQMMLAQYSNMADKYSHYFYSFLTDEELALLDRIELLDMLKDELFQTAKLSSISVKDDQVVTQFSGVTLQQAGVLQAHLLQNPMVTDAFYTVAQTDVQEGGSGENKAITITMTIMVQQPEEGEVSAQ